MSVKTKITSKEVLVSFVRFNLQAVLTKSHIQIFHLRPRRIQV